MPKLYSHFVLSPKDVGIEHYSVQEIAKMMEPVEHVDDAGLYEFAFAVHEFFEGSTQVPGKSCQSHFL